jgi:hypothetical protein
VNAQIELPYVDDVLGPTGNDVGILAIPGVVGRYVLVWWDDLHFADFQVLQQNGPTSVSVPRHADIIRDSTNFVAAMQQSQVG